ncbi:apoptosis-antagonizing transcription factor [Phlyctochytrium arcticum]|nr:apoptosis-antagonizing transcription factor [Phlyctochytrium arcticum]
MSNPAPKELDPERNGADAIDADSDNEQVDDQDDAREHYLPVGRSKLRDRAHAAALDDPKYKGRVVTRKDMYQDEDEESDDGADFSDEEDISDEEDGEEMADLGDSADEDGSDDEELSGDDDHSGEGENDKLGKQLASLELEEKKLAQSMSSAAKADVQKGQHVRAQLSLWDGLLDGRIRIQRVMAVANRFPKSDTFPTFTSATTTNADKLLSGIQVASQELVHLVDELLDLRSELVSQNPAVAACCPSASNKRKRSESDESQDVTELLESTWKDIHTLDTEFKAFRDPTIEKWSAKVQLTSGAAMQKKFKAINQSTLSQIRQVLNDKDRLIKRTQLRRSEYRILGEAAKKIDAPSDEQMVDDLDDGSPKKDDAHLTNFDAEIFDDGDYYQQLLKELIESRMADTDDPVLLGMKYAQLKQMQKKQKKKKVDTKASKGRKIRYHVHEKLQNFMVPEPRGTWHEQMTEELFSSLLGRKQEASAQQVNSLIVQEGSKIQTTDGLRIMG